VNDIVIHPILPWLWLVSVILVGLAGIILSLSRGIRSPGHALILGILRTVALGGLLLMLLQPQRRIEETIPLRPQLAILVDNSGSMYDLADPSQSLRSKQVSEWFRSDAVTTARKTFDLRLFSFDRTLGGEFTDPGFLAFNGSSSHVIESVNEIRDRLRGQPLSAVLLLSDGLDSSSATPGDVHAGDVPVHTFELEKPFVPKKISGRISLSGVDFPPRVIMGWGCEVRVSLLGTGLAGQSVTVELWSNGKQLAETQVTFNEQKQIRVARFPLANSSLGTMHYEIRVNDPAADKDARSYPFLIQVLDQANRVIYIQNTLGFDFKYLRKAIGSDRNLQICAFVRWPDGRLASLDGTTGGQGGDGFSPQSLASCSVLILGDLSPEALSPSESQGIVDFVDKGGGLVLLGGPNLFTGNVLSQGPMGKILPIRLPAPYEEGSFPLQITESGQHHPVFGPLFSEARDFPPLLTCNAARAVAPNAEVLMQAITKTGAVPMVVSMRYGQGHVLAVMTDTMWRWRLASKGWGSDRSPHDTFWIQLMDWMIPKQQDRQEGERLELYTEHTSYTVGDHPEIRAILHPSSADSKPPVSLPLEIRTPEGKIFNQMLKPANFRTRAGREIIGYSTLVEANAPGLFTARSEFRLKGEELSASTRYLVDAPVPEFTGRPIDRDILQRIAASTGGRFYTLENRDAWLGNLHVPEEHYSRVRLLDLWNNPLIVGSIILLLVAEWVIRKLWNLP